MSLPKLITPLPGPNARAILERNRPLLEESAARLLETETLEAAELAPIFARITPAEDDGSDRPRAAA